MSLQKENLSNLENYNSNRSIKRTSKGVLKRLRNVNPRSRPEVYMFSSMTTAATPKILCRKNYLVSHEGPKMTSWLLLVLSWVQIKGKRVYGASNSSI